MLRARVGAIACLSALVCASLRIVVLFSYSSNTLERHSPVGIIAAVTSLLTCLIGVGATSINGLCLIICEIGVG